VDRLPLPLPAALEPACLGGVTPSPPPVPLPPLTATPSAGGPAGAGAPHPALPLGGQTLLLPTAHPP
jgi:hypothetical protein